MPRDLSHHETNIAFQGSIVDCGAESPLEEGSQALLDNEGPERMVLFIGGAEEGIGQSRVAVEFAGVDDGTPKLEEALQ